MSYYGYISIVKMPEDLIDRRLLESKRIEIYLLSEIYTGHFLPGIEILICVPCCNPEYNKNIFEEYIINSKIYSFERNYNNRFIFNVTDQEIQNMMYSLTDFIKSNGAKVIEEPIVEVVEEQEPIVEVVEEPIEYVQNGKKRIRL